MLKNLLGACVGAIGFFIVGFAVAYGGDQTGLTFIGDNYFGLRHYKGDYAHFFFEFTLAATAVTIVAGAIAERSKMIANLSYSFLLTGFVYPVIAHSLWDNNGFLSPFAAEADRFRGVGAIDFAGSGVIHMVGGLTSLVAVAVL
jgi:Amt family ammonium transporter